MLWVGRAIPRGGLKPIGNMISDEMIQASDLAGGHAMNSSRENQESTPESKTTETTRAEAFDKWLCWNPGHNAREREIVAHMTPGERAEFQQLSLRGGAVLGLTMAGAMGVLMLAATYTNIGVVGLVGCLVAYLPVASLMFIGVRRSAQRFLHGTAWCKAQGWDEGTQ
jgi:hypothetical protein